MNNTFKIICCVWVFLALTCHAAASTYLTSEIKITNTTEPHQPIFTQGGWPQIYSGGYQDNALDIKIDSKDNIIVTGFSVQTTSCNAYTIKYDNEGNEIWNASYNSGRYDVGFFLTIDNNDDIIILGYSGKLPISEGDCFILKYSSDGIEQWNNTFSKGECNYPGGLTVDSQNNIIINGGSGIWQMNVFYWTIKFDENCVELWNHTFHESSMDVGFGVAVDSQDNIIATGISFVFFVDPIFIFKYDKDGNVIWEKRQPGAQPWDVKLDSEDNIIVTGSDYTQTVDMLTMKCDKDGTLLWSNKFDSGGYDGGQCIAIDSKNNIIVGGYSMFSNPENYEHCAIIYDTDGNELCLKREGIQGLIDGVAVDSNDEVYITGLILGEIYGYYTTKFIDVTPPEVQIVKPKPKYLHIGGIPLLKLPKTTIALGKLTVSFETSNPSDIDYIEIYLDKQLAIEFTGPPFEWAWDQRTFGKHFVDIIAYDNTGSACRFYCDFWKLL